MELGDFKAFYGRHALKIWSLAIMGPLAVITLGCLLWPELFWDGFIYRYYWGPLEVDANEGIPIEQEGYVIHQGYTIVSELTYGIILIVALYGIFRLLERLKFAIDLKFVLSVLPFIFLGATLRIMEDAELYKDPFVFLIISPVIYFVIGALIIGMLLSCKVLEKKKDYSFREQLILGARPFFVFDLVYVLIYANYRDSFTYMVHPAVPVVLSIGVFLVLAMRSRKSGEVDGFLAMFLFGLFLLSFTFFILMLWPQIPSWTSAYLDAHDRTGVTTEPMALPLAVSMTVSLTLAVYALGRILKKRYAVAGIFNRPINMLIVFGQSLDAVATFVGVDLYGYSEKHPLPDFFFQTFGTSAVFIPIKLALACAIVYLIDISFKEELKRYPIFLGLIKIIVIILGLAPGTRDVLRTAMGI